MSMSSQRGQEGYGQKSFGQGYEQQQQQQEGERGGSFQHSRGSRRGKTGGMGSRQTMFPNIGLSEKVLGQSAEILKMIVADEWVLFAKAVNYQTNARGERARLLCELFEEQAHAFCTNIKLTSQQLRGTGEYVPNLAEVMKITELHLPNEGEVPAPNEMIESLLEDQEYFLKKLCERQSAVVEKDWAVSDFILDLKKSHRVLCWKLRAHIEH